MHFMKSCSCSLQSVCVQPLPFSQREGLGTRLWFLRLSNPLLHAPLQVWFIVPVTVVLACFCVFLLFVPLLSAPLPPLIALGFVMLGVPAYFILVMDNPWRIRPKIMDRISGKWFATSKSCLISSGFFDFCHTFKFVTLL